MYRLFLVCLLCVTVLTLQTGGASAACGPTTVLKCASPLTDFTSTHNGSVLTDLTNSTISTACSLIDGVSTCLTKEGCSENDTEVRTTWSGLRDGLVFLCTDGRDALLINQHCLRSNKTVGEISKCDTAYFTTIHDNHTLFCSAAQTMLSCLKTSVQHCRVDGAAAFLIFAYKTLAPSANVKNCILKAVTPGFLKGGSAALSPLTDSCPLMFLASFTLFLFLRKPIYFSVMTS